MPDENGATKRRSIYLPEDIYDEMQEQANRYGISVSKCIKDSWKIARCYEGRLPHGVSLFRDGPVDDPIGTGEEDTDV